MISITDLYEYIRYIVNKSKRGTSGLSPNGFNVIVPRAVDDLFNKYYGLPTDYKVGSPLPAIGYEQSQAITDAILKQKNPPQQITVDSDGYANYPDDYIHLGELYYHEGVNVNGSSVTKKRPVDVVRDGWRSSRLDDSINPPSLQYPIASLYNDYILVEPTSIGHVFMTYLSYPDTPELAYTVTNDVLTLDSDNSTDIDLPKHLLNELAYNILDDLGLNMSSQELKQAAELYKAQGQ